MRDQGRLPIGVYSATPTPFTERGEVDLEGLINLMSWQRSPDPLPHQILPSDMREAPAAQVSESSREGAYGVDGFVIYGTTGEAPTLSLAEREQITRATTEAFPDVEVIAGVGSYSTANSVELAIQARSWGASGGLVVTPYYNKPSQAGLYQHFATIAEATPDWPLILYVVPSRAAIHLEVEVIDRLLNRYPNIVGIKDATADLAYTAEVISCCEGRASVLSGDDPTALAAWSIGARGSISVASNLVPRAFSRLWRLSEDQEVGEARRLFLELHPLIRSLFLESNPVPLKAALAQWSRAGLIPVDQLSPTVRSPLSTLSEAGALSLSEALEVWSREGQR